MMPRKSNVETSVQVLNKHAKSFSLGGFFLPKEVLLDAAALYHFCRYCDDVADGDLASDEKITELKDLRLLLKNPIQSKENQAVHGFHQVAERTDMNYKYARHLLNGLEKDQKPVFIEHLNNLIIYSYEVAGTVGGMMCSVLRIRDQRAYDFAIDLGIGMQITNICRDVKEDFEMNRVYLPQKDNTPLSIQSGLDQSNVMDTTKHALSIAHQYYRSGEKGFRFIPFFARFGILVAARLYEAIGTKLLKKHQANPLHGRTYLNSLEKSFVIFKACIEFWFLWVSYFFTKMPEHDSILHKPLEGYS